MTTAKISAGRSDHTAITAEAGMQHRLIVAKNMDDPAAGCVPDARRRISAGRDDVSAVRAELGIVCKLQIKGPCLESNRPFMKPHTHQLRTLPECVADADAVQPCPYWIGVVQSECLCEPWQ